MPKLDYSRGLENRVSVIKALTGPSVTRSKITVVARE